MLNVLPFKPVVGNSTYGVTTTFFGLLVDISIMTNMSGVSTPHWDKGSFISFYPVNLPRADFSNAVFSHGWRFSFMFCR